MPILRLASALIFIFFLAIPALKAQIVINEASNRNFNYVQDEDGDAPDWIELYNGGTEAIDLEGYALTDNPGMGVNWNFSHFILQPGDFLLVFCSGKDRQYTPPFQQVAYENFYVPQTGWNVHDFDESFTWDGTSDLIINSCSYNSQGYTTNSVFYQSEPGFSCSIAAFENPEFTCLDWNGEPYSTRPVVKLNGISVGQGTFTNEPTEYPAPYGNWWGAARNQSLYKAEELLSAGIIAGPIQNLAWNVESTPNVIYTYVDISIRQVDLDELNYAFVDNEGMYFHTDFKIDSEGEVVYLLSPDETIIDQLEVSCTSTEMSAGLSIDGMGLPSILSPPSPGESNNGSEAAFGVLARPEFSLESGIYPDSQSTFIYDISGEEADIHYTLNGDEPSVSDPVYNGQELIFNESTVVRARAFKQGFIPSSIASESYLMDVSHTTPIASVVIEEEKLYGPDGIFTNWFEDSERFAQVMYFDSSETHPLLFERDVAMQVDGGAGGSRSHPQHSFRLEMAKGSLNETPVNLPLLPNRPEREEYSRIYFRNGSNMWLSLPYKDGCQVEMMMGESNGYFSAMRAVSVYINGAYFGVYEMREKLDAEFYKVYDQYTIDDPDVLSHSNWNGGALRATEGEADDYWESWGLFTSLDPLAENFMEDADSLYDMDYLADYIIAETWMGNTDWPWNNIKISRSDASDYRWRFSTIDLESCFWPWGWTDCEFNGLQYVIGLGFDDPYTGVWLKSVQNQEYRDYFINRYADLLNTSYRVERLVAMEESYFNRWLPEMLAEYQRWVEPWNVEAWHESFINNHELFQEEVICKSEVIRDQVQDVFELNGQVTLTLQVEPAGAGLIHINTITPQDLPWDGIYYHGVPVQITAEAAEGYTFQFWEDNGEISNFMLPEWNGELNMQSITFTAVFETSVGLAGATAASKEGLELYPNPASEILSVKNDAQRVVRWEIMAPNGQILEADMLNPSARRLSIPIRELPAGVYMLRVYYLTGEQETARFVKSE